MWAASTARVAQGCALRHRPCCVRMQGVPPPPASLLGRRRACPQRRRLRCAGRRKASCAPSFPLADAPPCLSPLPDRWPRCARWRCWAKTIWFEGRWGARPYRAAACASCPWVGGGWVGGWGGSGWAGGWVRGWVGGGLRAEGSAVLGRSGSLHALPGHHARRARCSAPIIPPDGGGMKGMATVRLLREMERHTGKRIHELFDLIGGSAWPPGCRLVGHRSPEHLLGRREGRCTDARLHLARSRTVPAASSRAQWAPARAACWLWPLACASWAWTTASTSTRCGIRAGIGDQRHLQCVGCLVTRRSCCSRVQRPTLAGPAVERTLSAHLPSPLNCSPPPPPSPQVLGRRVFSRIVASKDAKEESWMEVGVRWGGWVGGWLLTLSARGSRVGVHAATTSVCTRICPWERGCRPAASTPAPCPSPPACLPAELRPSPLTPHPPTSGQEASSSCAPCPVPPPPSPFPLVHVPSIHARASTAPSGTRPAMCGRWWWATSTTQQSTVRAGGGGWVGGWVGGGVAHQPVLPAPSALSCTPHNPHPACPCPPAAIHHRRGAAPGILRL